MIRDTLYPRTRALVTLSQSQQLPFLAAAIAYYAFLSMVPLLIIGLTITTAVAGQTLATELISSLDSFLTPEAAGLIEQTLVDGTGRSGITLLGLGILTWGSLRVFRGLDIAFSRVYGSTLPKPLLEQLRDAIIVLSGIAAAITVTVVIGALLSFIDLPLVGLTGTVGLLFVLSLVFFPLYYVFPGPKVGVREAIPGAVFAACGWTVLGAIFGLYAANAGSFQLYGLLGGVLLLLVWFYFGGLILLVGAAVNVILGDGARDKYRQLQQEGTQEYSQQATMSEGDGPTTEEKKADSGSTDSIDSEQSNDVVSGTNTAGSGGDDDPNRSTDGSGTRKPGDDDRTATITQEDIDELRREIDKLEDDIEDRTVHRKELEKDLKKYVRGRVRRGHAAGWGPYLVLLYGTVMTLGAFYLLNDGWAVLAMLVIWLSTLGLYTLMVIVGISITVSGVPSRVLDLLRGLR